MFLYSTWLEPGYFDLQDCGNTFDHPYSMVIIVFAMIAHLEDGRRLASHIV